MARVRTVDFLPEIFRTPTNKQFLSATLDQLVQEPAFQRTQGYVGRRVGPGVNANDKYVIETTASRQNYQLEPGVVMKKVDSDTVDDAITYPGISDALAVQGALTSDAQRLYTSDYYTWDPMIDFDKFVNFSQYYWLPGGPDPVDVSATTIPLTNSYTVTRENGVYTFSGYNGDNPILTLVRGGNYTFEVAQNNKETVNYRVTAPNTSGWTVDYLVNPTLTLVRGNTYVFNLVNNSVGSPFWLKTAESLGRGDAYNTGVTRNGSIDGNVTFVVPQDAPDTLYYVSETQYNMRGTLNIIDATPGTGPGFWIQTDPGVDGKIPSTPNISSRDVLGVVNNGEDLGTVSFNVPLSTAQNFYYGLTSIGTVDFVTTNLKFNQINNQFVVPFLEEFGGIDGITNLNGRTIVFANEIDDPEAGGWEITTQVDPLTQTMFGDYSGTMVEPNEFVTYNNLAVTNVSSSGTGMVLSIQLQPGDNEYSATNTIVVVQNPGSVYNVGDVVKVTGSQLGGVDGTNDLTLTITAIGQNGLVGSFGSTLFDQTLPITSKSQRYGVWQIQYVTTSGGSQYMRLNLVQEVAEFEKFSVAFGDQYASTQWYKDSAGYFLEIPLLTAIKNVLYYQDGTDPGIFGQIKLIDQDQTSTLDVEDIIGQTNYTSPNGVTFTNGLKVQFRGDVEPISYQNQAYYVEGVGTDTGIQLLPVDNFITPETYTQSATVPYDSTSYDSTNYDASLNAPLIPDYLIINRASPDLSAWSRTNRWFHIDVINASAEYNNVSPVLDNNFRAKRPIVEFRAGTRLFNFGTSGKQPVNVIDFEETDALSNINGSTGYGIDGYDFIQGTRVIFAADLDPQVRNKVYTVTFITPDTVEPLIAEPVINLVPADDAAALLDQTIVCLSGTIQRGKSYWFDGITWQPAQDKTETNQAPLFNVYDSTGVSFSDRTVYPSSTFEGSKLFSYALGTGTADTILGFPLRYLSLANVGDIVFDNNLYTDTFVYVENNNGITKNVSNGFVRQYQNRTTYLSETGWQNAITKLKVRQQFQFTYDGAPIHLDIAVLPNETVPSIIMYIANEFIPPADYTFATTSNTTTITLSKIYTPGDIIEIDVLSDQVSPTAFYTVPDNLENNPFNVNSSTFTLGTVRSHYETIGENLLSLEGPINGANNSRDLGNIGRYGTQIVQQSAPLTLAGFFMRSQEYNIFKSLEFNDREYTKFKNKMLETVVNNEWGNYTTAQILDAVIIDLATGKTDINSFYYSDMIPAGEVYIENDYTVTPITTGTFDTVQTYDFDTANFLGLLVWINDTLLTLNYDYTVATDGPRLTITTTLNVGDVVKIREYTTTVGNFVPNTPTKLGLYPAYKPEFFYDENYINPTNVIRGHDGSITVAFGDIRDDILLEFERRVFNNLKLKDNPIPLTVDEVIPGYFRETDYTQSEITQILSESFLTWVGWNKLDYKTQQYSASNPFTYNYSDAGDKEKNLPLLGAWRGISRYFYDTLAPNYTPWEMLGFSEKPSWWENRYGPAPYTADNLVLWGDLEAGYVADPAGGYVLPQYVRPNLTTYFIPNGGEGQLLAPLYAQVGQYDPLAFKKSWVVGDGGPVEAAWWMSSSYPFAVMRLLALTRPAEFFALFADRDLYRFSDTVDQYLYNGRYRLDANGVQVYGNGVSKASYIDWIVDYNQQLGINSTTALEDALASLDVRLCYRMGTFSDKQYMKIFTERSSPNSLNSSLLLPDESYNLLLYKNTPFATITYSSVIVQRTVDGYAVYGYSITDPYFNILASRVNGRLQTVTAGGTTVQVPRDYSQNIVQVPYGFVFTNQTVVVDFLLSYGRYLEDQGLIFDNQENGFTLNWNQMAQEFLYWANQGWGPGSLVNLNPAADRLVAERPLAVVDSIAVQDPENMLLDQNRTPFDARNLIIERLENSFSVSSATGQAISYIKLNFVNYENLAILDNVSIFNDLIYDPVTGARQNRVNFVATTASDWNGTLDAQGFILNRDNIQTWLPTRKYAKGEIVLYKNTYWSAQTIVQPKREFDYNDWVKSDYTAIQKGLLPNIANKADQLANSYSTQVANIERDNDLLSYGLIGFKPREYMTALNLDDPSQVQLYQQFVGSKGTVRSAEIFTGANLNKEVAEYNIYENWAVLRGTYGANANRSFFELRLNEALLPSDPSTIQVVNPQESSIANQQILLSDVWRQSYKLTSPNILPTTTVSTTDTALPSAGYVNVDDVDITVFSLDDPTSIAEQIESIGVGTKIWVAKTNAYDWNVYRTTEVPGRIIQVSDNLDGTSLVTFTNIHNLSIGSLLIVRYFNSDFDGVYRVLSTPKPNTITVAYTFTGTNQIVATGTGIGFYLNSMRVSQASDIVNLPYVNDLVPGALAWVDDNGSGLWEVLEKQTVFTNEYQLSPYTPQSNSGFGTSVSQSNDNSAAVIGAPSYNNNVGTIYPFFSSAGSAYTAGPIIRPTATGTQGFGSAVDTGNSNWTAVGAPASNNGTGYLTTLYREQDSNVFLQTQLLVAPDQDFGNIRFGSSVAISNDERWMYVGAPGSAQHEPGGKIYAFGKVYVQPQSITYTGDGVSTVFNYSDSIEIDYTQSNQLVVSVSGRSLAYGTDYTIDVVNVNFTTPPANLATITITRRQSIQLDHEIYYNVEQDSTTGSGTGAKFTIARTRGVYSVSLTHPGSNYANGDTITILGTELGGASPANNLTITVNDTYLGGIIDFSQAGSGVSNTAVFNLTDSLYTATDIYSVTVIVNGIMQRPFIDYDINEDSSESTFDITFNTVPVAGAIIVVDSTTYWKHVETITVDNLSIGAEFGTSVASSTDGRQIVIGAPRDTVTNSNNDSIISGSAYIFNRSVSRYLIANDTTTEFNLPVDYQEPVAVLVNGEFLTNTAEYLNGEFTVDNTNPLAPKVVLSNSVTLNIGDTVEVESNIFRQVQRIVPEVIFDEAEFGTSVDMCSNNCSIYIGAPNDGQVVVGGGSVQRNVNQSRVYGIISSTVPNAPLTAGQTIRVNNFEITVPSSPDNNVAGLVDAINSINNGIGVPNVVARASNDVLFTGNGTTQNFNIGSTYSAYETYYPVVYVDDVLQTLNTDYTYNNTTNLIQFVTAPTSGLEIRVVSGILTLNVNNPEAITPSTQLTVWPGNTGTVFESLGFVDYYYTQTITSPNPVAYAQFGYSTEINTSATNLVVGAPLGNMYEPVTFDNNTTYFDDRSTIFSDTVLQSGTAYTFDYLPSANGSITNPGKFVFGQQVNDLAVQPLDQYGTAVSYVNGILLSTSPGNDLDDSGSLNYGRVSVFENLTDTPAWTVKHVQQPVVDINLINGAYMYDKLESVITSYLDFFNPLQGKILGVAQQNIDYTGAVDPASYNSGPIRLTGNPWSRDHVGEIWWDTNLVRFIDPNQDDIAYASRRWGQVFPGSRIDIYQWIESTVTPANYTGPGAPLSLLSYTTRAELNTDGIFETRYYFWVRNISTVNTVAGKKLSTTAIANYIENPRGSGIAYMAPLNASTIAIYNCLDLLSAADTIIHIDFDQEYNEDNVHQEYELIAQDRADSFLSANLYLKLQDSFCGVNNAGALVPDPTLSPAEQYGVQFRPRQSMFANRFGALKNYLGRANTILAQYPITETRKFNLLNSSEPEPSVASGAWNKRVADLTELGYQNLVLVPYGYKYLVATDSSNNGLWTIYEVVAGALVNSKELTLIRVQSYDTPRYWTYINWYQVGYNSTIKPVNEVVNYADLASLTVAVGSSVRVTNGSNGKWEIYLKTDLSWERVGLENGTIEFNEELWNYTAGNFGFDAEVFDAQYFDQEPTTETRKIIQAINEELFVDDLAIERNRALMLVFNYVLSEFEAPEWLIKTSLIDVDHKIRQLLPYQVYRQDNQDFVLDYIQEVKPYHTQIREFNLQYDGSDAYPGMVTDFDVPAYYDNTLEVPQYISPVLLPYTQSTAISGTNFDADTPANSTIWTDNPYNEWYNNYLLSIQDVVITNPGVGYTVAPEIVVTGECITQAEMSCVINSAGQIVQINIDSPGSGYSTTAVITFVGGNGAEAAATVVMGNDLVRSIKTVIKYDRYEYSSTIVDWEPGVNYDNGTQVRYLDRVWQADSGDSTGVESNTFDPDQWTLVSASTLSGVDRTMGLYVATPNQPGLELPLLIDGIDYPGVQVFGVNYNEYPGYDNAPYDSSPYDNLAYGPEGRPTYDQSILDAIYTSVYNDPYLGTLPAPAYNGAPPNQADALLVEGGAYIDTYSSHAPEELIPGSEFDTLDLRVYTTPGADWARDGHGFRSNVKSFAVTSAETTFSFSGLQPVPARVELYNLTTQLDLALDVNYTVNWAEQTFTITDNNIIGNTVALTAYEIGGGNQLMRRSWNGAEVGNSLTIPVEYDLINELVIFVNGEYLPVTSDGSTENYTYSINGINTQVDFVTTYDINDYVMIVAMGLTTVDGTDIAYSWSTPVSQYIVADGTLTYELTNSLAYTNPDNLIVTVNGQRARTSAGIEYLGDGSTQYLLPGRLGFSLDLVANNEVHVYVDDVPLVNGIDFVLDSYDAFSETRSVTLFTEVSLGQRVLICVSTNCQAIVDGTQLMFNTITGLIPQAGDIIEVITWNDTRQQNILTQVFVGPIQGSAVLQEGFDDTVYDLATVNNTAGSFDYSEGQTVTLNNLIIERTITNPDRLWVTLNGRRLTVNNEFTLNGNEIILANEYVLTATDIVIVTEFTNSIAPESMAFRIFQDMRGVQATYSITPDSSTYLVRSVSSTDDIIYVYNIEALDEPNLSADVWGVITINGERIMYRERDVANNTVSGLLRGTAGTAIAEHASNSIVYSMGRGNLLPEDQDYIVKNSILANGTQTTFTADDIDLAYVDSTVMDEALEVYVGGTKQVSGYTIIADNPVSITFDTAPADGSEVTMLVRRGTIWYAPGIDTPSDGVALQDTNTDAARFLRGEN